MSLPYKIVIFPASEGGYVAEVPELPGCLTQGDSWQDTFEMIQDAKASWIDIAMQDGIIIPEPTNDQYNGKLDIRIPKSLHEELAFKAKKENVSLNQLIISLLSSGT